MQLTLKSHNNTKITNVKENKCTQLNVCPIVYKKFQSLHSHQVQEDQVALFLKEYLNYSNHWNDEEHNKFFQINKNSSG